MLTIKESTKTTTDPSNINIDVEYEGQEFNISTSPVNNELSDVFSKDIVLLDIKRSDLDRITYSPQRKEVITKGDDLIDLVRMLCDNYNKEVQIIEEQANNSHEVTSQELVDKGLV